MQALETPRPAVGNPAPASVIGTPALTPRGLAPTGHRALVAYGSRFGNTRRIAEAISRGLHRNPGLEVDCRSIDDVDPANLTRYELIAVGAPTEILSAPRSMKEFLEQIPDEGLRGKRGFAFDTRLAGRMSGSAGRYIERHLERLGLEILRPHASATVRSMTKEERTKFGNEGAPEWVRQRPKPSGGEPVGGPISLDLLLPGSEDGFEKIGIEIGTLLAAAQR